MSTAPVARRWYVCIVDAPDVPALAAPEGPLDAVRAAPDGLARIAHAVTALPAAALEAHLAPQLAAVGWQRLAAGAAGPLAWSTWALPAPGDRRAEVVVVETPGQPHRTVLVQAAAATAPLGALAAAPTPAAGR